MWAIPTGTGLVLKKKNQVKSPSPESRVPETGSDPPFGSGRDSGRDKRRDVMTNVATFPRGCIFNVATLKSNVATLQMGVCSTS